MILRCTVFCLCLALALSDSALADGMDTASDVVLTPLAILVGKPVADEDLLQAIVSFDKRRWFRGTSWERESASKVVVLLARSLAASHGQIPYSETMQPPMRGRSAVEIDCETTDRLMFAFVAGRSDVSVATFKLRTDWHMDGPDGTRETATRYLTSPDAWQAPDIVLGRKRPVFVAWRDLRSDVEHDGPLTLEISYRGTSLYRERFELVNCGRKIQARSQ